MTLQVETCPVISIQTPDIEEIEIEPLGQESELVFDEFIAQGTEPCGYAWSYEAFLGDDLIEDSIISNDVQFDADERTFKFSTTKGDKSYDIIIKGILSDGKTSTNTTFTLSVI